MSHDEGLPEEHEEHVNHEAWVIPYADLLTLLMAMFIALFAMSTVDMSKFQALAVGFNEALGGGDMDAGVFAGNQGDSAVPGNGSGGLGPAPGATVGPESQPDTNRVLELLQQFQNMQVAKAVERDSLEGVREDIEEKAGGLGLAGKLSLRLEERGLVVTVVTDQVLFDSGSAQLRDEGKVLLEAVAEALKTVDNPILIEGHTDSLPISTAVFASNWELSSGRAGSVARFFESIGLDRMRLRPQGLADLYPVGDNRTPDGRAKNRRVEIVIQSKLVDRTLREAGLGHDPVEVPTDPVGDPVDEHVDSIVPDLSPGPH